MSDFIETGYEFSKLFETLLEYCPGATITFENESFHIKYKEFSYYGHQYHSKELRWMWSRLHTYIDKELRGEGL